MNKSLQTGFSVCLLLLLSVNIFGQQSILDTKSESIKQFKWLEGRWKAENVNESSIEEWHWINDTLMKGRSYSIHQSDTIVNEIISIIKTEKGIFYIAEVASQNNAQPVYFELRKNSKNQHFTFENFSHDFPQSISYKQINKETLDAWIEGKGQRFDFRMKKLK